MNEEQLVKIMDEIPFFKEMDKAECESLLVRKNHWIHFKPQETILKEGEVNHGFFVLLEGQVSVMRSKPAKVSLAQLVPGSIFGEITMKAKKPRTSSIEADDDVTLFKVDSQLMDQLSPEVAIKIKDQIIDLVITRLDEVNNRLSSFIR
jgi:CRP-like cAMP-binding protein